MNRYEKTLSILGSLSWIVIFFIMFFNASQAKASVEYNSNADFSVEVLSDYQIIIHNAIETSGLSVEHAFYDESGTLVETGGTSCTTEVPCDITNLGDYDPGYDNNGKMRYAIIWGNNPNFESCTSPYDNSCANVIVPLERKQDGSVVFSSSSFFAKTILYSMSGIDHTLGFSPRSIVSWSQENLYKLFIGSGLAVLYELRYWIMALIIIGAVVYFSYRAYKFFQH